MGKHALNKPGHEIGTVYIKTTIMGVYAPKILIYQGTCSAAHC